MHRPHTELKFDHYKSIKNCFLCHNQKDPDSLLLITKEVISFDQSFKLCSQCHGEKSRDWEMGMHGRQIGSWKGTKFRSTCTDCHNPHHPKFPQIIADPPLGHQTHIKEGH